VTQTRALLLTLALEVPLVLALVAWRRWAPPGRLWIVALAAVGATLLTHPLLWLLDPAILPAWPGGRRFLLPEVAIVLLEGAVYAWPLGLGWRRGLLLSALANALSYGAGLLIQAQG
jgi:hypothetical protein